MQAERKRISTVRRTVWALFEQAGNRFVSWHDTDIG